MDLKPGDVVQLKSGGPKMTISKIGKFAGAPVRITAVCEWFDGAKKEKALFEPTSIKIAEESKPVDLD